MELKDLPMRVGYWYRKSEETSVYRSNKSHGLVASINCDKGIVDIGAFSPCAVQLKLIEVDSMEDVINALTDFKGPFVSEK